MRSLSILIPLAAILLLTAGQALAQQALEDIAEPTLSNDLRIDTEGDLVSVRATAVDLARLLRELSTQTDLLVEFEGVLDQQVTTSFERLPLKDAVAHLLEGRNYLLRSPPGGSADDSRGYLWVSGHGPKLGSSPIDNDAPPATVEEDAMVELLLAALADSDHRVRVRTVLRLAGVDREDAVTAVAQAALVDPSAAVRAEAAFALGEIADPTAKLALDQALLDSDRRVREAAVAALVDIGDDDSAWALVSALADEEVSVREETVYALGAIGGDVAIGLLQSALSDPDQLVVEAAAELLQELAER